VVILLYPFSWRHQVPQHDFYGIVQSKSRQAQMDHASEGRGKMWKVTSLSNAPHREDARGLAYSRLRRSTLERQEGASW
jgi:hypothetical protein